MFRKWRRSMKLWLALLIVCLLGPSSAFAGWLGFRNDTKIALVVQETIVVNNVPRPGKPEKLGAGDTVRDLQACPNPQRKFTIYDAKGQQLYTGVFPCPAANENVLFAIKMDAKGKITIEPIKSKK
jgi:hypothetical protein